MHHDASMQALGLTSNDWPNGGLRICEKHKLVKVKKRKEIVRTFKNGTTTKRIFNFEFEVPESKGIKNSLNHINDTRRLSTARERSQLRQLDAEREEMIKEYGEKAADEIISRNNLLIQAYERETPSKEKFQIAPVIAKRYGIKERKSPPQAKRRFKYTVKVKQENERSNTQKSYEPTMKVDTLSEKEVKRRTGFDGGVKGVLRYIALVCNGDFSTITRTVSEMSWFEEWMLSLEIENGKTWTRWEDLLQTFNISEQTFYKVFDSKIRLLKRCRDSWPPYASHEEDVKLRGEKWNMKYGSKRIILWDGTNGPFTFKPSTALNQRRTWSSYYAHNCAKGGIFLQYCGWLGVEEYFPGGISDSLYVEKTGLLKKQQKFAEADLVNGEYIPFTNILDKGYRIIRLAWEAGKQECIQPVFAQSDRQFSTDETLISATVAADRSGNERAVRYAKVSGFIQRGLKPNACPARFSDIWLTWSFQTNFMYASVV